MTETENQSGLSHVSNVYYEIGGELLSKPNALAQIIEASEGGVLVFCNTPSDTDLVEVLLKKRGIAAKKLIGNVPAPKLEKAIECIKSGEISALIVTDIAARGLDIDDFSLLVHYTAPADADTYIHRVNKSGPFNNLKCIATLIAPLDITNFHYVKKAIGVNCDKIELPEARDLATSKVARLDKIATSKNSLSEERFSSLASAVLSHKNAASIVAYLLQNTLEVIPTLQLSAERAEEQGDDDFDDAPRDNRRRFDRNDRGNNNRRNDRNDRGGRDYDRGEFSRGEASEESPRFQKKARMPNPSIKDARMYLGLGTRNGISESSLRQMLDEAGLSELAIKRMILRSGYTFFDVAEDQAQTVLSALKDKESVQGSPLFIKKATIISSQNPEAESSESEEIPPESSEDDSANIEAAL